MPTAKSRSLRGSTAPTTSTTRPSSAVAPALRCSAASIQPVNAFVVRVEPSGGRLEYRFYDAKTFRLDRLEEIRDGRRFTVTFDDYRTTDGLVEPWHIHTTDGFATNDGDRILLSRLVGTAVAPSETAIPPDRLTLIAPASLPAEIPATMSGDAFVVPVKLGAYTVNCIFDSGADGIVIDSAVIGALGLKTYGHITSQTAGTYVESDVIIPTMAIGNVTLNDIHARSLPFTQWTDTGKPIAGLLGYDVIRSAVWHLDYVRGTIEALPAATFTPPPTLARSSRRSTTTCRRSTSRLMGSQVRPSCSIPVPIAARSSLDSPTPIRRSCAIAVSVNR